MRNHEQLFLTYYLCYSHFYIVISSQSSLFQVGKYFHPSSYSYSSILLFIYIVQHTPFLLLINLWTWINQTQVKYFRCGCSLGLYSGVIFCLLTFHPYIMICNIQFAFSVCQQVLDGCFQRGLNKESKMLPEAIINNLFIVYHCVSAVRVFSPHVYYFASIDIK